ncbi:hypothetical protein IJJ05_02965 [Candidatus Saccharibacteria bacterium]|nr:hypothetical protein [Candidatus Saccharibacteria bacterium]
MNEDVRVSKQIVEAFWARRVNEGHSPGAVEKFSQVCHAEPKELISDFRAIHHILGRAIKELKK